MIRRCDAVAGFFEDLPVLMFVLMGVSVLVGAGTWVAGENASLVLEQELDHVAYDIVQRFLREVLLQWGEVPRVSSLAGVNESFADRIVPDGASFTLAIASIHPSSATVATATRGDDACALATGFASALFNAADDDGLVSVMEVRVIAW